ncbi:hypothetical protein CH063_13370 [Colletotrichum higginsianum]|uniref:Uncharacterized protein n=1 Tax=Colletotrichum higginsianum (strain IMI 349063) TaxID=759273 RepID=H1VU55_COLHI|nr:hypothetical protein CH063_13370 [Colletotrichum higginsianum]
MIIIRITGNRLTPVPYLVRHTHHHDTFCSLKRLLPCSPPNAHVGSHDEVQHLEALWVDNQLAELGSLAAIAAAGPFPAELQVERARRLVLVAVLAVAVAAAAADLEQPAEVAAELLPLALLAE